MMQRNALDSTAKMVAAAHLREGLIKFEQGEAAPLAVCALLSYQLFFAKGLEAIADCSGFFKAEFFG